MLPAIVVRWAELTLTSVSPASKAFQTNMGEVFRPHCVIWLLPSTNRYTHCQSAQEAEQLLFLLWPFHVQCKGFGGGLVVRLQQRQRSTYDRPHNDWLGLILHVRSNVHQPKHLLSNSLGFKSGLCNKGQHWKMIFFWLWYVSLTQRCSHRP